MPTIKELMGYDTWANRESAESLIRANGIPDRAAAWLAHIAAAEWLWWSRIKNEKPRYSVWPTLTPDACDREFVELGKRWHDYIDAASPSELARTISYTNSKGEPWSSRVEDILFHLVIHSAHHRGQIAAAVRAGGSEPAYTDYIHAVRTGALLPGL